MNDLISRQAAIDEIRFGQSYITKISPTGELEHLHEAENNALEEAVERIEGLPSVNPQEPSDISNDGTLTVNVEDGRKISRVLVCGANHWGGLYYPDEQEPKTGHWKEEYIGGAYEVCSECHFRITKAYLMFNYCPNCGAKMEKQA